MIRTNNINNFTNRFKITIFGPYDIYRQRLNEIARYIRDLGFSDTKLVSERKEFRERDKKEESSIYIMKKSYYFVEKSNMNIFIFYYNAYNDSMILELKEMCDKCRNKIPCSLIIIPNTKEKNTNISRVLKGQILSSKIATVEYSASQKDQLVDEFIKNQCRGYCDQLFIQKLHSGEIK